MASAFLQSASSTANATSYTFSAQNTGSAAADRYILVAPSGRKAGAAGADPSVSVGGNAATKIVARWTAVTNSTFVGLYLVALPTGTSDDVVVDFGASTMARAAIIMWRLDDLASATASDTDSNGNQAPTATIDVPTDGCAIAAASTSGNGTCAWTNLTERDDGVVESAMIYSGASDDFPSGSAGLAITATFTSAAESAGVFASWEFGAAPPASGGNIRYPSKLDGAGTGGVFPGNRLSAPLRMAA